MKLDPFGHGQHEIAKSQEAGLSLVFSLGLGRLWRLFGFSIFGSCSARFSL
jgi:hypothetical protein